MWLLDTDMLLCGVAAVVVLKRELDMSVLLLHYYTGKPTEECLHAAVAPLDAAC